MAKTTKPKAPARVKARAILPAASRAAKANQREEARKMLKRSLREEKQIARLGKQVKAAIVKADESVRDLASFIAVTVGDAALLDRLDPLNVQDATATDRPDYRDGIGKLRCGRCLHEIDLPVAEDAEAAEVEPV